MISYSLTFMLLAAEVCCYLSVLGTSFSTETVTVYQMVTFCLLVAPLPHTIRKNLLRFLSESYVVAKIAYGLKISFMSVSCVPLRGKPLTVPPDL